MESSIVKLAQQISRRDKETFDSLIDFEKTKRLHSKTRLNFTVDRAIAQRFRKHCKENSINMSAKIEQMMKEALQ